MVGGSGGARSEDQWKNRRMEMAPCGGVGCNSVFGQEVADLLLATTATASRGLRRLDLLSLGAPSSWCMMIARRRCGGGFSGAWTRASNAKFQKKNYEVRTKMYNTNPNGSKDYLQVLPDGHRRTPPPAPPRQAPSATGDEEKGGGGGDRRNHATLTN
ncbi:hypothetical protein OsI_19533 [Oryza sativa Indica Group]|uniref:Uncharacterized protein n=1 Tax=Oryza sativa subsp. indica TaxID=39946 RepID=B8AWZ8_ORYSI|nr:hypothetical protein OsI_19533 [Oryza sativa Indica Group]